jgi:hypothetical protein
MEKAKPVNNINTPPATHMLPPRTKLSTGAKRRCKKDGSSSLLFLSGIGMRDRDVAPKYEVFREARRDRVPAAADKAKLHGCSFALEIELEAP